MMRRTVAVAAVLIISHVCAFATVNFCRLRAGDVVETKRMVLLK